MNLGDIKKEKMLDAILRNSKDLFFVKDSNYIYLMASDSFAKLYGFNSGEEIVGLDDFELTGDNEATNIFRETDYKVLTTGEPVLDSLAEGAASGVRMSRMISTSKYPIFDEYGRVEGVLGICHDITPELRLKRTSEAYKTSYDSAVAANSAKTEFLSRMSHDIRTPMNAIMGLVALSQANLSDTEKVKYNLERVQASGKYLLSIINEVLDMEKIETNQIELNVCEFDMEAFIDNFEAMMASKAAEKKQSFSVVRKDFKNSHVLGDSTRIEQIFVNLTNNAIKYTPELGAIRITVTENEPKDGIANYEFVVEDTGEGMSPEFMEHLFEPFSREKDERVSNTEEGIGLGLAIAGNLVTLLGGNISAESQQGKGSKFTVNIPLVIQKDETKEAEESNGVEILERVDFSGKRALLVEDNGLNAEIAQEILGITGIEVERAEDGQKALEMFAASEEGYYDVIFMDIQMPIMDGYEATRRIRMSKRGDSLSVPIMAMTANAFVSDINEARAAGMNEHVAKPVDFDKLIEAMNRWVK
ncbi:MAG: ATP-binding protein [Lachnospiraceae bacterium]|nr:ATP-binding protein [Lachnospiraceae bacterium]